MTDNEIIYNGKFVRLVRRNGWEYVERNNCTGIVAILPITNDGKIILIEQYRPPVQSQVIEIPAGLVDDKNGAKAETHEEAARRELLEETGYHAHRLDFLFAGPPSAGISSEMITFYLGTELEYVNHGGGDESEQIKIHKVNLSELENWLAEQFKNQKVVDTKVFSALYFLKQQTELT